MTAIDTITLKTAVKTSGIHLPVGPWDTTLAPNPGPQYVRATDWSGGLWQKILPKENATTNMVWAGTCWTVNGNEIRCGPLRTAAGLQIETATCAGTITGTGNMHCVLTAVGMTGSPITLTVAVAASDTPTVVTTKVKAALALNATIAAYFTIGGTATTVQLTTKLPQADDATMNINLHNDSSTGFTDATTSTSTLGGGAAITAKGVNYFLEAPNKNWGFFASDKKKYVFDGSTAPYEVDSGGATAITDVCYTTIGSTSTMGPWVIFCLGTAAVTREYDCTAGTWASGIYRFATTVDVGDLNISAGDETPTTGTGTASWLHILDAAQTLTSLQVGSSDTPITKIIEFNKDVIIFKSDGMYMLLRGSAPEAVQLQRFPPDANNGKAVAVYNGGLYFSCGDGMWVWRGTGMAQPVPVPSDIDSGQIGKVYSLRSIDRALLVGFLGWAMILVEDGPTPGYYWWHYLATNSGKTFNSIYYTVNLGCVRPRIYFGFETDTVNNVQYTELVAGDFLPYEYATNSYLIFPGIYMGPEMYPCLYKDIQCGTRNLDASKTIQWTYTTTTPNGSPSWTNFGSAITANGFITVTPATNVSGALTWFKATMTTNVTTTSPILDWVRWKYYPRVPAARVWSIPLELKERAQLPGGGRQASIDSIEVDLAAARNQTNPCLLTIPSQGITDVSVMADMKMTVARSNPKRSDVTAEAVTLILREVV